MATDPLPADRLETRFRDAKPLLGRTEAISEASRCLYCFDAPCISSCPTAIDIPTFIRKIATGNLAGSARTILEANLLGASCARVCPVEVLCEGDCVYVADGRPAIPIGRLQRYAMEKGATPGLLAKAPPSGFSVGLVGSGPASLACAGTLVLLGHEAVIYERDIVPGGLNTTGVAPYKLKTGDSLSEVEFVRSLGVGIEMGVEIGRDLSTRKFLARHDAAFLGPGLGLDSRLDVEGVDGPGVRGAVEWIREMKIDAGAAIDGVESALVIGGGNTAVDVARELAGLGVRAVKLIYRRDACEMKAYAHELAAARREGVSMIDRAAVDTILRNSAGALEGARLVATEGGQPGSHELGTEPADLIVIAIGQAKLEEFVDHFPDVRCDDRGRIRVDLATFVTDNPRIFAGGDAVNGGQEVVNAVHDGREAARAIDALLRSSETSTRPPVPGSPDDADAERENHDG